MQIGHYAPQQGWQLLLVDMLPLPSRLMGALPSAPLHHRQRRHSTANGQPPTVQRLPGSVPCCPSASPPAPLPVSSSHLGCLPPLRLGEQPFWDGIPSVACCSRDTRLCSKDSACNSLLLGIHVQISPVCLHCTVQCCAALRCTALHCAALREMCLVRFHPMRVSPCARPPPSPRRVDLHPMRALLACLLAYLLMRRRVLLRRAS